MAWRFSLAGLHPEKAELNIWAASGNISAIFFRMADSPRGYGSVQLTVREIFQRAPEPRGVLCPHNPDLGVGTNSSSRRTTSAGFTFSDSA